MHETAFCGIPDFSNQHFLLSHINKTLAFYHPHCIDWKNGGFFHFFRDDGSIYDRNTRHLVSSTRFIFNYAMALTEQNCLDNEAEYRKALLHGIAFLRVKHRNSLTGGYAWVLEDAKVTDDTNHCYGLAFVLLAYASAYKAGVNEAKEYIEETYELLESHFWSEEDGLYCDEASANWQTVSSYRGQNANMHSCEALIAAYEATANEKYLNRAFLLAKNICVRQASKSDNMIWEHYHQNWTIDWKYNQDDPGNLFRPWGYQPGHFTEWSKLLLILERHRSEEWLLPRARELFDIALRLAWDKEHGGICYSLSPAGDVCDGDKYFWVQAESFAAAALLAKRTDEECYKEWYQKIWQYSWQHFVDHKYGAWFRILQQDNRPYDDLKSPAGKTDYHTMGACYEVLRSGYAT